MFGGCSALQHDFMIYSPPQSPSHASQGSTSGRLPFSTTPTTSQPASPHADRSLPSTSTLGSSASGQSSTLDISTYQPSLGVWLHNTAGDVSTIGSVDRPADVDSTLHNGGEAGSVPVPVPSSSLRDPVSEPGSVLSGREDDGTGASHMHMSPSQPVPLLGHANSAPASHGTLPVMLQCTHGQDSKGPASACKCDYCLLKQRKMIQSKGCVCAQTEAFEG